MELFTLSISLFFEFNSLLLSLYVINFFSDEKDIQFLVIEYFLGIFGTGLISQNCEGSNFFREIIWRKYSSQNT